MAGLSRAAKIVAERASQGLTYELLLRGIMGNDLEKRNRSLTTLCYLHERGNESVHYIRDRMALTVSL